MTQFFIELKNNIEFFIHARKYFQLIYQEVLKLKDQNSCYFLQSLKIYCLKENYFLWTSAYFILTVFYANVYM